MKRVSYTEKIFMSRTLRTRKNDKESSRIELLKEGSLEI